MKQEATVEPPAASGLQATEKGAEEAACKRSEAGGRILSSKCCTLTVFWLHQLLWNYPHEYKC